MIDLHYTKQAFNKHYAFSYADLILLNKKKKH